MSETSLITDAIVRKAWRVRERHRPAADTLAAMRAALQAVEGDIFGASGGPIRVGQSGESPRRTVPESVIEAAPKNLRELAALVAERDRYLTTLDAIGLEAHACADVNEPISLGWLIATIEEAIQGV